MKLTSALTTVTITLVNSALMGDFQPIPALDVAQVYETYQIEGGRTKRVPHGNVVTFTAPTVLMIHQASDALAHAMLLQLVALIATPAEQPFTIQWNDHVSGGAFDGLYWVEKISTAEVSSQFKGRIKITLGMAPV